MNDPAELTSVEKAVLVRSYWYESRRPLVSLAFVSPLLIGYEGGILLLGPQAMRNGAEVWLRSLLDVFGFGQYFLLPVLTVGLLLAWHHTTHERWYVPTPVLYAMAGECTAFAFVLIILGHLQGAVLHALTPRLAIAAPLGFLGDGLVQLLGRAVGFFGAGIYEEVLFRLMLLPILIIVFGMVGAPPRNRIWGAIVVSSLLFSAAHYVGAQGDPFTFYSFIFRFIAGAFFAILFWNRGFGIAAGTHALYDIIVGLL
jgi:membrane protease YdiL (CAAX protease family)